MNDNKIEVVNVVSSPAPQTPPVDTSAMSDHDNMIAQLIERIDNKLEENQ